MPRKTTIKNETPKPKKSYEELEKENNELMIKMNSIEAMLAKLMNQENVDAKPKTKTAIKEKKFSEEYEEVNPNKRIPVVSLYNGTLALTTEKRGGIEYLFSEFGTKRLIKYAHLSDILLHYDNFAKYGYFYIENDQVVSNHGLIETYEKILSKEEIDKMFTISENEMISLFQKTTEYQREEIMSWLLEKISNGESVDYNRLETLKKIFRRNANTQFIDDGDVEVF